MSRFRIPPIHPRWRRALAGAGLLALALLVLRAGIFRPGTGFAPAGDAPPTHTIAPPAAGNPSLAPTQALPAATGLPAVTETPAPFRFTFPTPGAAPVSAWRPPLPPLPWAPTQFDHFFFARPIAADEVNWPEGNYRYGGIFFEDAIHTGVDVDAAYGAPVIAAGPGKVIWAGYGLYSGIYATEDDPYGIAVAIKHDFGYEGNNLYTVYGHLARVDVVRGQHVETGQQLGLVGDTGFTTGPHLHLEVRMGENNFFTTYNPELWVAPPQGWGVLAARIMGTGGQLLHRTPLTVQSKATGQRWVVYSYGSHMGVNPDPYYRENLVMGDLPAGEYVLTISYLGHSFQQDIRINPGLVTFFTYQGRNGYDVRPPATPGPDYSHLPITPTLTPTENP